MFSPHSPIGPSPHQKIKKKKVTTVKCAKVDQCPKGDQRQFISLYVHYAVTILLNLRVVYVLCFHLVF